MSLIALADGSVRPEVLADPYRIYAKLRTETPVIFDQGVNAWLVSRYDDVRALALDTRLAARRSQSYFRALAPEERARFELFARTREAMLFYLDGPTHARIRRAVAGALHESVAALGPALVVRHAEALVERIATSGDVEVDLVRDLAEPLPRLVLSDLLGLPEDEAEAIYRQSVAYNSALGGVIGARHVEQAEQALRELRPRLLALAADPAPGSILAPLRDAVDAHDLTEDELVASAVVLVAAGHETTTGLIANALVALARNPERAGRGRIQRRGEAALRRRGPAVGPSDPADRARGGRGSRRRRSDHPRRRPGAAAPGLGEPRPRDLPAPRRVRARATRAPVRPRLRDRPAPLPRVGPRPYAGRGRDRGAAERRRIHPPDARADLEGQLHVSPPAGGHGRGRPGCLRIGEARAAASMSGAVRGGTWRVRTM